MSDTATPARDALRPKHRAFFDAYCQSWCAAAAARAAGYAEGSIKSYAHRLPRRADFRAALIEREEKAAARSEAAGRTGPVALARAFRASVSDYMVTGADGEARLDFARLARDQMTSDLAVEIRDAGPALRTEAGVPVPASEIATLRLKLNNRPAARERSRDPGDARPHGAAAIAQGLHPVTGKPITNHDRAKAIYHLIERAKQDPDGIASQAAVNAATGQPLTNRERAETILALLARVKGRQDGAE